MIVEEGNLDEPVYQGEKSGPLVRSTRGLQDGFIEFEWIIEGFEKKWEVFVEFGGREVEAREKEIKGVGDFFGGGQGGSKGCGGMRGEVGVDSGDGRLLDGALLVELEGGHAANADGGRGTAAGETGIGISSKLAEMFEWCRCRRRVEGLLRTAPAAACASHHNFFLFGRGGCRVGLRLGLSLTRTCAGTLILSYNFPAYY